MQQKVTSLISMCGRLLTAFAVAFVSGSAFTGSADAQIDFDRDPIRYSSKETSDPVAKLQQRIDSGKVKLDFDERHGYLPAVLRELGISHASQNLVFSKTSFQLRRISPRTPRALYFNDESYIGWVQNGEVIEVSAVDPEQGAIFYTLDQTPNERPQFVRDRGNCLTCHASSRTQGVPGYFIRSVYSAPNGQPHFGAGTFTTDQTSPFEKRWGGWYITGTHGKHRHMGNVVSKNRDHPEVIDVENGANVTELKGRARTGAYLTKHSDIVAIMVLGHQASMHNLITRANFETRVVQHDTDVMNRALERPADHVSETSRRRVRTAAEKLLKHMLFVDETNIQETIEGTSSFADEFSAQGPFDSQGRSLRQFDLQRRMFKYPCSYLIYSESFDAMPDEVKHIVFRRLWEVLKNEGQSEDFSHLSADDRAAIFEILLDTKPSLSAFWKVHALEP